MKIISYKTWIKQNNITPFKELCDIGGNVMVTLGENGFELVGGKSDFGLRNPKNLAETIIDEKIKDKQMCQDDVKNKIFVYFLKYASTEKAKDEFYLFMKK